MPNQSEETHEYWETGIDGLQQRHVKSIYVDWDDKPPKFVAKLRLKDIFKAIRLGFEQVEQEADEAETRLRANLATSQEG